MSNITIVTPPTDEPLTLAEVQAQCRPAVGYDDAQLKRYIAAARDHAEVFTARAIPIQTLRARFACFPWTGFVEIPRPPLRSVKAVRYLDGDGSWQTVDPLSYVVDTTRTPGVVYPASGSQWPQVDRDPHALPVEIEFTAGYDEAPPALKLAMLVHVESQYAPATDEPGLRSQQRAIEEHLINYCWGRYA